MRFYLLVLMALSWSLLPAEAAEEPRDVGSVLQQRIDALEASDLELAEAQQRLKSASVSVRPRIQARIKELEAQQKQILQELERMVGPLPPRVASDSSTPLEESMKVQEKRHETVQESDVDRRLPR